MKSHRNPANPTKSSLNEFREVLCENCATDFNEFNSDGSIRKITDCPYYQVESAVCDWCYKKLFLCDRIFRIAYPDERKKIMGNYEPGSSGW